MRLCIDIGNTRTSMGLFDGDHLVRTHSISTAEERTSDEYGVLFRALFGDALATLDVIVASVVPVVEGAVHEAFARHAGKAPQHVSASTFHLLENRAERPTEVGIDRLINAYAGRCLYGAPLIIVDLGTAVTWDVVSHDGAYLGGAIAPGLELASRALATGTARLPRVRIEKPPAALGRNTVTAMESGLYYGLVGAVTEIADRICRELGHPSPVVATGGHATLLAEECRRIDYVEPHLTLKGLARIAVVASG